MKKTELPVLNTVIPESVFFEPHSRKSGREERQDAAQNRQKVLEAARRLFNSRGIDEVTMSDIAKEAGVGKGTLYRRYPDKGTLCMALVDQATSTFQDSVLAYLRDSGHTSDPLEQLSWFLGMLVSYIEENSAYLKPAQESGLSYNKKPYYDLPVYNWQYSLVFMFLREAVTKKVARPDLDVDYVSDALLAPLQVDLYLYQRQVRGFSTERIVSGLCQWLNGIRNSA